MEVLFKLLLRTAMPYSCSSEVFSVAKKWRRSTKTGCRQDVSLLLHRKKSVALLFTYPQHFYCHKRKKKRKEKKKGGETSVYLSALLTIFIIRKDFRAAWDEHPIAIRSGQIPSSNTYWLPENSSWSKTMQLEEEAEETVFQENCGSKMMAVFLSLQ